MHRRTRRFYLGLASLLSSPDRARAFVETRGSPAHVVHLCAAQAHRSSLSSAVYSRFYLVYSTGYLFDRLPLPSGISSTTYSFDAYLFDQVSFYPGVSSTSYIFDRVSLRPVTSSTGFLFDRLLLRPCISSSSYFFDRVPLRPRAEKTSSNREEERVNNETKFSNERQEPRAFVRSSREKD